MIYIKAPLWSFFYTLELMNVGKFLIATPSIIGDANFQRSVVLLVDQKESGTVGFILNKKLDYTLDEVMDGIAIKVPVYFGGPVEQDSLFFIHRAADLIPNSIPINKDFYWSGDYKTVIELINSKKLEEDQIRFFLGYTGWGEKQLEEEIESESWILGDASLESKWIKNPSSYLWRDQMNALGGKYLIWSNAPENPSWN